MLAGKHILVGISGGIAAYKIPELIRLIKKAGAEVKVTTTKNALEFVTPLTLETLSQNRVYSDCFAPINDHSTEHISLPDWADAMVIAPATANIIGKIANGIADDALSTTFLAMSKPVLIAPAMNEHMFAHPALQHNLDTLRSFPHCQVMDCAEGFLACGTTGKGRMQEPAAIFEQLCQLLTTDLPLQGKKVVITAGPTVEKIDPVRFISNFSSGKMGIALAEACAQAGAEVQLILGPTHLRPIAHPRITITPVQSAQQMYDATHAVFPDSHIAILCAAVADYRPAQYTEDKIKREKVGDICLQLEKNPDIAATLGQKKRPEQLLIGFALETAQDAHEYAMDKIRRKNLDMIVLNTLADKGAGFGTDTNKVTLIRQNGQGQSLPLMSKDQVAKAIVKQIASLVSAS